MTVILGVYVCVGVSVCMLCSVLSVVVAVTAVHAISTWQRIWSSVECCLLQRV